MYTHTLLWWDEGSLPAYVERRIQAADAVFVSAASAWEIAIKTALGKIVARGTVADVLADYGFTELPITVRHAEAVRALPPHHRDPFDRFLVAQAELEGLALVSKDPALSAYGVRVVWR
ncbi:MAG: type II toxin-antitoxin system VapC family toxin [Myxococcales bacterium]|nr:type II toxin-antitoxin system VapC family toxin [Myxococcales bacterium]